MLSPNTLTHLTLQLRSCTRLIPATSIHATLLKSGLIFGTQTSNHLINCYVKLHQVNLAHQLFDEMPDRNVVSWTSLMAGYVDTGCPEFALSMYIKMAESWVAPNDFTLSTVINACSILGDYRTGKKIHAHVEVFGFQNNLVVCSSLVDMYGKCNDVDVSRRVFDLMAYRNVVSWTSIIAAYAQNARGNEALQVFREFNCLMRERPNHFMLAIVINACASLGKLVAGKGAHGAAIRQGYNSNDVVKTALVDMYAKCGSLEYSDTVFRMISNPSLVSYTSMIVGAAKYGLAEESLKLFREMIDRGIRPNDVTLLGVLYACSHAGLVDEGLFHLNSMHEKYGIIPEAKHYCCVVQMLSRVGQLDEAYQLAKSIMLEPDQGALLWAILLSAGETHGRIDIVVEASKQLMNKIPPDSHLRSKFDSNKLFVGAYVALSNSYASAGDWASAYGLRLQMNRIGIQKDPGCSWIEIKDSN